MRKLKASSPVRKLNGRRDALNLAKKTARARSPTGDSPRRSSPPEQAWAYLRSVCQESPEGICLVDASMRVVVWNRAATEITGCEASEVLGRMRHEGVASLILIFRQGPFPLQLLTRLDSLLTRFAAPQESRGPPAPPRPLALTSREREILRLLAAGKTAKPIATELGVSLPTVRTHIQNLLCKLEVHSCLEAVVWYFQGRPADPEPRS